MARNEARNRDTQSQEMRRGDMGGRAVQRDSRSGSRLFPLWSPAEWFSSSPFELMRRFSDEMDRWRGGVPGGLEASAWVPAIEVYERDRQFVVRAELPGMRREDVTVEIQDDSIVVQGERRRETESGEPDEGGLYRSEWSYGRFFRRIPLPEGIDADQARARFDQGILEIAIPLPEQQRRRRQIPVESAGEAPRPRRVEPEKPKRS
jgi:HSP20 family protein